MSTLASGPVVCLVGGMYSYTVTTTVPHGACGVYELLYVCGIGADCVWRSNIWLMRTLWAQCRPVAVPLPRHGSACGVVVRTRVPWCFCLQRPYMYHSPHPGAVSSKPYAYAVSGCRACGSGTACSLPSLVPMGRQSPVGPRSACHAPSAHIAARAPTRRDVHPITALLWRRWAAPLQQLQ